MKDEPGPADHETDVPSAPPGGPPRPEADLDPELAARFGLDGEEWVDAARRAVRERDALGRLGDYELVREIGRGAQGAVYMAIQPGTGRVVALKRLGAGFPLHLRDREHLRREVEALTPLNHPNVVAVFAAEELDGHAVLVMEYVDGVPIDRWADGLWGSGCVHRDVLHAVLTCFVGLCEGVSHAHQRGVIHCDIKPSNALVTTQGAPKVVDFGIARVTSELGGRMPPGGLSISGFAGTPAYAAPEQVLGSPRTIDTRCDVYALGVLLRRILTGVELFGHDASLAEIVDAARTGPGRLRPLSSERAGLPSDLDWVVRRAMQPDPADRYQSVDALAEDVRRTLDGRATLAHPPSIRYTARRFVSRHRAPCTLVGAAVLAIVSLAWVSTAQAMRLRTRQHDLSQALQAERLATHVATGAQRDAEARGREAQTERDRQRETAAFLLGLVEKIAERSEGRTSIPIEDLVKWIDTPDDPATANMDAIVRARLGLALGVMYNAARRNDLAAMHDRRALELLTRPGDEPLRLRALLRLSSHSRSSLQLARDAVGYMQSAGLQDSDQAIEAWRQLSAIAARTARFDEALAALEEARQTAQRTALGPETESLLASDQAARLLDANRVDAAAAAARRALDLIPPDRHSSTEGCRRAAVTLGETAYRQGDLAQAEKLFAMTRQWLLHDLGDGHVRTRNAMRWHARALHELERYDRAAAILERLISLIPPHYEKSDIGVWRTRFRYAATLLGQGRTQEADRQLRLAITRGGSVTPDDLEADVALARRALQDAGLKFTPALRNALGPLGWVVDFTRAPSTRPE